MYFTVVSYEAEIAQTKQILNKYSKIKDSGSIKIFFRNFNHTEFEIK